jgi:hypothetical protein
MVRFGITFAGLIAFAAPALAYYPPEAYPFSNAIQYAGAPTPDMLPPITMAPGTPMMAQPGWSAQNTIPNANDCGYAFDPCNPCDRIPHHAKCAHESWARADCLYWRFRDMPLPVLLATGNPAVANPAIPGLGNITPLIGGPRDVGRFNGIRATVGQWLDEDGELGVEFTGFVFGREGTATFFSANPVISVPLLGVNGAGAVYDFNLPGQFSGVYGIRTASKMFGGEANLLHRWYSDGCVSFDTLLGYRHVQLKEQIELLGRSTATGGIATFNGAALPAGVTVFTTDTFRVRNEFHGAQIGGRLEVRRDMFTLTLASKGGAGVNLQTLRTNGLTTATGNGASRTAFGGVRVLPTNFGRDTNTDFSMLSESQVEFGFQVTKNLSLRVGYNLLFWSDVVRPGNVISPVTSFTQVPIDPTFNRATAATRPVTVFRSSDFLAHGLILGLQLDY